MIRPMFGLSIVVAAWVSAGAQAQVPAEAGRVPVLAELFTSEGCDSCPPADRLLETLLTGQPADDVYVVGLSEHVTYWDHQGWKDPFGSLRFTERQQMYARRFHLESAFTPQLVIDGAAQMVGSDAEKLRRALADAARTPKPRLTVAAANGETGGLSATASGPGLEAGAAAGADLLWAVTEDHLVVDVTRGENANRTLRHAGVVRHLASRKIDPAIATMSAAIALRPEWKREHLRLVAFVQSTKTKRVLSVGWTGLPPGR